MRSSSRYFFRPLVASTSTWVNVELLDLGALVCDGEDNNRVASCPNM